uniref:Uncharacterized protein n=1 Tax=Anguilla anguilla TaxID=7936 RepID=A0A0E9TK31_ANGAN
MRPYTFRPLCVFHCWSDLQRNSWLSYFPLSANTSSDLGRPGGQILLIGGHVSTHPPCALKQLASDNGTQQEGSCPL